jgi:CubicO group peptidase (beta-lactamase class C family)
MIVSDSLKNVFESVLIYESIIGLQEKLEKFVYEQRRAPGVVIAFGTSKYSRILAVGNQQELNDDGMAYPVTMQENSIFDMSSITKIFTCLAMLKLVDMNVINLTDDVFELDDRFINLKGITVEDLLAFRIPLRTEGRIESATTLDEAEKLLFEIQPDKTITRLYSDMGAMVLKYVLERLTGKEFYSFINEYILTPCGMTDTLIDFPNEKLERTVSNNFERRIVNGNYIVLNDVKKGIVSDGKARKINQFKKQLHGHAGMFSTVNDMVKLTQALMRGDVVDKAWLDVIGVNRTGTRQETGEFSQFHGYMCYSKNPVERDSEVNHFLSGNAFALGGYTGNQLTIDNTNQVFIFMASNRCHNRVTSIIGEDCQNACGKDGYVEWNDGNKYLYNKDYVYERDPYVIEPAIKLALQYRFLECLIEKNTI